MRRLLLTRGPPYRAALGTYSLWTGWSRRLACTGTAGGLWSATFCLRQRAPPPPPDDEEYAYEPDLGREAQSVGVGDCIERYQREWLPDYADEAVRNKVREALRAHPINEMIMNGSIMITHTENEEGQEVKLGAGPMPLSEAMKVAQEHGRLLVQLAENNGTSYCRLRDERKRVLATVQGDLDRLAASVGISAQPAGQKKPLKAKESIEHTFRDVVDAHFIGWRSKKIVQDLRKRHPCKLSIQKFESPEAAIAKMQEMMAAVKETAVRENVIHFFSGINVSPHELTITLQPVLDPATSKVKAVRHPTPADWEHAEQRLLSVTGGRGTYQKSKVLKARAVMAREYRVDRFGRRIEDQARDK